jgi:hypothetical protein
MLTNAVIDDELVRSGLAAPDDHGRVVFKGSILRNSIFGRKLSDKFCLNQNGVPVQPTSLLFGSGALILAQ